VKHLPNVIDRQPFEWLGSSARCDGGRSTVPRLTVQYITPVHSSYRPFMRIQRLTLDEWGDALPTSGFEWAHRPDVLRVIDDHATGELQLYGGFKGEQPVGLFPVIVRTELFATAVLSPPPGLGVPRMGPILLPTSPKPSKQEKVNREFTAGW
jgi:hypothetical protein